MTLEEAMQEIFYHAFVFTLHPKKRLEALKVIRKSLIDYKQLKSDYADLDNRLRTANTEIDRLQSVSSWIPCSERMPDSPIRCAVITENGLYGVSRYMGRNMIEWSLLGDIVTHWMPLPKTPQRKDDTK